MADVLQDLTIVIDSEVDGAESEIDKLSAKLTSLANVVKTTKSGVGSFSKNYTSLINSIKSTSSIDGASIEKLNNLILSMKQLDGFKMSGAPGTQIEKLMNSLKVMQGEDFSLDSLDMLMDKLSGLSNIKLSKGIGTNLKNIADFSQNLDGYDFTKLGELTDALSKLGSVSDLDSKAMRDLASSVKTYTSATNTSAKRSRTFNTVLANIKTTTLALVGVAKKLSGVVQDSLTKYGDYIETMNLFSVSMGNAGKSAYEFALRAQELLGIDLTQWMKAQGVFMSLGKGFGIAEDKAATMSQQLTQLAYDISSFYNISVEDAIQKVQSAFSGELEPVRRLGYDLSQARLQAIALSYGIDENVSSMTQAEKASLRYVAMLTQVTDVQGDLARTIESPTNQLRVLNAQVDQMKRSIGMSLVPMLNKILPYLNATFRVIKMIADEIAALFGYTLPSISESDFDTPVVSGLSDIEDSAEGATEATEKLKNTLASFDQINLIGSSSSSGGSGSGSASAGGVGFDIDVPTYDFLGDATGGRAKQIAEDMMRDLRPAIDFVEGAIKWISENLDIVEVALGTLATVTIGKKLVGSIKDAKNVFGEFSKDVLGISLVTIGVTLSFSGGKSLAEGDWLEGLLKSTIGTAAMAKGFTYLFGPGGMYIGVGLGLVVTLSSFMGEKKEQQLQELDDLFWSLDNTGIAVEKFTERWDNLAQSFVNADLKVHVEGAEKSKQDVDNISQSIANLIEMYQANDVDLPGFAANMEFYFSSLEESVSTHLDNIGKAFIENLKGPFGEWMRLNGVNVDTLISDYEKAEEQVIGKLSSITSAIESNNYAYEHGLISKEQYDRGTAELMEDYNDLKLSIIEVTQTKSAFDESFDMNKINFDSVEDVISAIDSVTASYKEASESIVAEKQATLEGLNVELQSAILSGDNIKRREVENAMSMTETYYNTQIETLETMYRDTIGAIENQEMVNWKTIYDVEGLGDAVNAERKNFEKINEAIDNAYKSAELERYSSDFATFTDAMGTYAKNAFTEADSLGSVGKKIVKIIGTTLTGKHNAEVNSAIESERTLREIADNYEGTYLGINSNLKKNVDARNRIVKLAYGEDWEYTDNGLTYIGEREEYAAFQRYETTSKSMRDMNSVVRSGMSEVVSTFSDPKDEVVKALRGAMSDGIGAVSGSNADFKNSTKEIMSEMAKVLKDPDRMLVSSLDTTYKNLQKINPNDWKNVGKQITTGIKEGINGVSLVDAVNNIKKPFAGIVEQVLPKKLGADITTGIKQGMDDKRLDVNNSANQMVLNIANPIKMFGGSAYDYFIDMASGISAILNGIKGGTGASATSLFTTGFSNVFKKWTLKGFASGGFVDSADFFYANENGVPEYIGSMGGRTAVANNQEITAGISDAVYKAIKDTGIGRDVAKIASKSGNVVFSPSEGAGRVVAQSIDMYNRTGGRY